MPEHATAGSFRTNARKAPSVAMKRDCSHTLEPGGGATPPRSHRHLALGVAAIT